MARLILICAIALAALWPRATEAAPLQQQNACETAITAALSKIGTDYVWGSKGPENFDCSGLTYWAYIQAGIDIGLSTWDQIRVGTPTACTLADLAGASSTCWRPGDLIFLRYPGGQHVALYVGDGLFADAYNSGVGVVLHEIQSNSFYQANFYQARRILSDCNQTIPINRQPDLIDNSSISIEAIADIVGEIRLFLPWSCGICEAGQQFIERREEPTSGGSLDVLYPFRWLAVTAWNDLVRPIICWMIAIGQAFLDAISAALNAIFVTAINAVWRMFVLLMLWIQASAEFLILIASDLRIWIYSIFLWVTTVSISVEQFFALLDAINQILMEMWRLIVALSDLIVYVFGYMFFLISAVVVGIDSASLPPQYAAIQNNFLWHMLNEMLRGIIDSKVGWAYVVFCGAIWIKFAKWILEELGEMNQ